MSLLAQRLNRLRGTYSVMLRLCDQSNHVQHMIGTLSERGLIGSNRLTSHAHHVARNSCLCREFASLSADQHVDANLDDLQSIGPEKIQENEYAQNLFRNSINYISSVMKPVTTHAYITNDEVLRLLEQDWSLMTGEQIVSAIKKLSYSISQDKYERIDPFKYLNAFNAMCVHKLSNDDLKTVMRHLVLFCNSQNYGYYDKLCNRIDKECVKRFTQLSTDEMLLLCDNIRWMMHSKSEYIWYSMRKLGNKPNKLTPKQMVQVLFFLNICRKPPINMYEMEYYLERCIHELSVNELAIAGLGFFKTGTKIRNVNFLIKIMRKIINEVEFVDSVSIGALLKVIRYSMQLTAIPTLQELVKVLTPYEPRFTLMSLTHISHACARVALYDEEFINRLIRRFNSEIKTARLKDFERFLFVLACFNIDKNNSVYQNIIEELRTTWNSSRAREISEYPQVISRILGFLAVLSIYPTDLIARVMAQEHLDKIYRKCRYLTREYSVLDYSLRLEVPEYNGPFLKSSTCETLEKIIVQETSKAFAESNRGNLLFTSVLQTCQEVFNTTSNISVVRALPHYVPPDIVFCLDEQNRLLPSKEFLSQYQTCEIMRVDKETSKNVKWIALVMAPHGLLMRNTNLPIGMLATKLRQLSIIGYTPVMISHISWFECASSQERCDYLKKLVFRDNAELSNK